MKRVSVQGLKKQEWPHESAIAIVKKFIKLSEGERSKIIAADDQSPYINTERTASSFKEKAVAVRKTRMHPAQASSPPKDQSDNYSPESLKVSQVPAYDANGFPLYINPAPT